VSTNCLSESVWSETLLIATEESFRDGYNLQTRPLFRDNPDVDSFWLLTSISSTTLREIPIH
jgi:hypothetical protein